MNTGVGVALGSWGSALLLLVVSLAVYSDRIAVEERALLEALGAPYAAFLRTRKRLIPFIYRGSLPKFSIAPRLAMTLRALVGIPLAAAVAATIGLAPAASPVASDEAVLRALHAKVIRAHRESNPDLLFEDVAADFVQANRGEIKRPTIEERRARFAAYLGSTTFEEYRDLVEPVVKVSKDGTLGWVIVQVKARGTQTTEAGARETLEFTSAWIELYEKRDGRWVSVGNLSNFK